MATPTLDELRAIFGPSGGPPERLTVLDVRPLAWDKRFTATCLQGIVNRTRPRTFLVFEDDVDRFWLKTYRSRYGVRFTEVADLRALAAPFADEVGIVIYDEQMIHSANVAQTFGSLNGLVPASPAVAKTLERAGLRVREDFRGRWEDRLEAYRWAVRELLPSTSRHVFGSMVLDSTWGIRELHQIRDYIVAKQGFVFDLSTRMRDREEAALWDEIIGHADYPALILGWHSGRSSESEYVTRAASHGLCVICSPDAANLSVHCAIPAPQSYRQKPPKRKVTLKKKVYMTFTYTDGDNIGTVSRFMGRNWRDSAQGKVPYTWEILPVALHMAPGMLEQYYRQATGNDYLIAGPSGFAYTYPGANARLEDHLAVTDTYFKALDLHSLFVMDWNPRLSFRELEDPALPERLAKGIDNPIGFTHNYSGVYGRHTSTGEIPTVFVGAGKDVPYVNSDVYVQHGADIYGAITRYVEACDWKPLFLVIRARDGTELTEIRKALDLLDSRTYEVLRLDQFLELLLEARRQGVYRTTSPRKEALLEAAAKEAAAHWWKEHRSAIGELRDLIALDHAAILEKINEPELYFPPSVVGDYVAWDALQAFFQLVRAGLFRIGVYAGLRREAVERFTAQYPDVADIRVADEAIALWEEWERRTNDLAGAKSLARRVIALSERFTGVFGG